MKDAIQEQFAAARRNQILDAAAKAFAEKGFHATTIRDIAREAGLADGTIYIYFANKHALLLGIFDRMRESILQSPDLLPAGEPDMRAVLKTFLGHPLRALSADHFALFRVILSEMMVNAELRALYQQQILEPTLRLAEQQFQHWIDAGLIQPVNVGLTVRALSSLVMGLLMEAILDDATLIAQWERLPDFLTDLILNGIRNTPA